MNYLKLETLNERLKNVSKEIIISLLYDQIRFQSEQDIEMMVINIKIDNNLTKQRKALDDIDNHQAYTGDKLVEWAKNHAEWERLNNIYDSLYQEYLSLQKQRDKIAKRGDSQ